MSVIVKGMEMPKSCSDCPLNYDMMSCGITGTRWWSDTMVLMNFDCDKQRLYDCPLVDVEDDNRGQAMSAIIREDAIEAILSRLMETEEPTPPWIFSVIRKCLDDLPSLPSTEPLVHDGFYLCDKKPGACPSWERKGWTKCESKHCNRTSRVDHALKLHANDGWIPVEEKLPENADTKLLTHEIHFTNGVIKRDVVEAYYDDENEDWLTESENSEILCYPLAWRDLPKPYEPKEDTQ